MTPRKSIRNYIMTILVINEIKKQFFSTIKEDEGQYTVNTDALAKVPLTFRTTFRLLPFMHKKIKLVLIHVAGLLSSWSCSLIELLISRLGSQEYV
jgi:hypothetical protein